MKNRHLHVLVTLAIMVTVFSLNAQKRPFPQNMDFENCIKPNVNATNMAYYISEYYKYWKGEYLRAAGSTPDGYYIYTHGTSGPNTVTVSEAHGYGMVAFALMAGTGIYADPEAKTYFDGMYKFFMAHPFRSGDYLMSWAVNSNGSGGETFSPSVTATDGDLDIGYALVLANYQWGANGSINYLDEAEKVIAAIKRYEMNPNNKRVMLCDYHDWSDQSHHQYWLSRCSDWMADHLRTFNEVTGDSYWNDAVSTIYSLYDYVSTNYSATTGLVPDWINYDPPQPHSYAGNH
jgi:endo-1,4-beta-D-glucanase Y